MDCLYTKEGNKDEVTLENKIDGNTRGDHLWNLWCEPEIHKEIFVLPAGAKTQKKLCWRDLGIDTITDKNTNKGLLKLNASLSCNPPFFSSTVVYPGPCRHFWMLQKIVYPGPCHCWTLRNAPVALNIKLIYQISYWRSTVEERERENKSEMKLSERNVTAKNVTSKNINL